MTIQEVIDALERVKAEFDRQVRSEVIPYIGEDRHDVIKKRCAVVAAEKDTKGGYFRVGNVCIKIAEVTELR